MKWIFDPGFRMVRGSKKTNSALIGSTILHVNLIPPEEYELATTAKDKVIKAVVGYGQDHCRITYPIKEEEQLTLHNSLIFVLRTIYILVRFMEHLIMLVLVIVYCKIQS